ncbi:hypothetical protein J4Q44_G00300120 [Coregonus suidteri]|uniref:THAP domain-containing protein 1 n=1 Tax=Coregonus suidteri TaxID=861788 RepID=A0AAN8KS50_9TELE
MPEKAHCVVTGCHSVNLTLHYFPNNEDIRQQWLLFVSGGQAAPKIMILSRVYSAHFQRSCFINWGEHSMGLTRKLILKTDAVPSLTVDQWILQALTIIFPGNLLSRNVVIQNQLFQGKEGGICCEGCEDRPDILKTTCTSLPGWEIHEDRW